MTPKQQYEAVLPMYPSGLLPTPTATDSQGRHSVNALQVRGWRRQNLVRNLPTVMEVFGISLDGADSQVNPSFAAEMMGFPPGWCDI
jgi:hypothetical protein